MYCALSELAARLVLGTCLLLRKLVLLLFFSVLYRALSKELLDGVARARLLASPRISLGGEGMVALVPRLMYGAHIFSMLCRHI